ncbi:MAG: DUF1700 domain-containing protein [Peptostreptococcus sp.]|uniref:DUF1700 domain-containing protein n=1 Tax=Peptostreptococcus sp. TaxID=1262 RepID=UPI002FCA0939
MEKNQFLKEIRVYLEKAYLNLNPIEIEDILRDYEEYFRDGISEGKNEEEMVDSLGDPKSIVDEMVKSDIEDGKYTKEDFNAYFEEKEKIIDPKKIKIPKLGINKIMGKTVIKMLTILFDILYFPAIFFIGIPIIIATLIMFTTLPYVGMTFGIIGQNKILLVFPIIFIIGSVMLEILLLKVLTKLGLKLNRKVFNINKKNDPMNNYGKAYQENNEYEYTDNDGYMDVNEDLDNDEYMNVNESFSSNEYENEDFDNNTDTDISEGFDNNAGVNEDFDNNIYADVDKDLNNDKHTDISKDLANDEYVDMQKDLDKKIHINKDGRTNTDNDSLSDDK